MKEEEKGGDFAGISSDEYTPATAVARKFILLTFVILLASSKSRTPLVIDSRWYNGF